MLWSSYSLENEVSNLNTLQMFKKRCFKNMTFLFLFNFTNIKVIFLCNDFHNVKVFALKVTFFLKLNFKLIKIKLFLF